MPQLKYIFLFLVNNIINQSRNGGVLMAKNKDCKKEKKNNSSKNNQKGNEQNKAQNIEEK